MRRYPLEPLASLLGLSLNQACEVLGVSGSTMADYRTRGVTERVADRLAVRAGIDPYQVWPEMLADSIADASMVCAECAAGFVPSRQGVRFCSSACRWAWHRKERRKTEQGAERARESARRYYRENRAYVLARQRAYDRQRAS